MDTAVLAAGCTVVGLAVGGLAGARAGFLAMRMAARVIAQARPVDPTGDPQASAGRPELVSRVA
jgi:hypothetical protein